MEVNLGRIIAIANQKGGVGKTTTAVNLAASLAFKGKTVLLIDMDPQANTTSFMGMSKVEKTSYDVLVGNSSVYDVIEKTEVPNLHIVPADINLAGAEVEIVEMDNREFILKNAIGGIEEKYDYTIIDCPPSLGLLTINALVAANTVIIPIQAEYFALEGLGKLLGTIHRIQQGMNSKLEIEGVLITMYDRRLNLSQQVLAEVKRFFPDKVYNTIIPRNVKVAEAPSYGKPIILYNKDSAGAKGYLSLAEEVINYDEKKE